MRLESSKLNRAFPCLCATVVSSIVMIASAAALAQAPREKEAKSGSKPPWQRTLQGDDAKRVEALEKSIDELEKKGQFSEAVAPAREALAIRRRVQGEDHWETVSARVTEQTCARVAGLSRGDQSDLAAALRRDQKAQKLDEGGRYAEAEPLLREIWRVCRRVLGEDHPDTATGYNNLAMNLHARGKYAEAEPLHQQVLAIRRRTLGEDHPDTAMSYNNLAGNLEDRGQYVEAEPLHQKALAIWRRTVGEDHPDTARSYNNVGYNLAARGKYTEAEPLFEKALAIRRRTLGEDHRLTASSYRNLAGSLDRQGKYAEAEPLYQKALTISRHVLGEDHPFTAICYNNLAGSLDGRGKYAEAEPLFEKALAIRRRTLGEDHPDTARSYNNVGYNLGNQGKYAEAEPLHQKALAIWRRTVGEDHPDTALSYNNLAYILGARGKYAEAEPLHGQALAIWRRTLGEDHPDTALSYGNLANNLGAQGKYAEAEPFHREALAIRRRTLGADHPSTATSYTHLATNLHAQGKSDEAEAIAIVAANSYEVARPRVSFTGLDRSEFAFKYSPLPFVAAILARRGRDQEAWQRWEAGLARGLFDDLDARRRRPLAADERRRQEELVGRLDRLDNQINSLAAAKNLAEDKRKRLDELKSQRLELQGELAQLESELVQKYKVAAGAVYALDQIQAQLDVDAALIGWLDLKTMPKAADPQGDHWACILRRSGAPRWIRIAGTGPNQAWTQADDQRPGDIRRLLGDEGSSAWEKPLAELAEQRLAPLEAALGARAGLPAVQHLIILPSPALAGIPVEAMLDARPAASPRYLVSYAPSGTLFAWLQERRRDDRENPAQPRRLLALGDPVPPPSDEPTPKPPDHGLLVQRVARGSNADTSGVQPGDVLLRYAGAKLATRDDLQKQVQTGDPKATGVATSVWRNGEALAMTLHPGPLGVVLDTRPAAEAILAQRQGDALLRRSRGAAFDRLPGSRREVESIASLFDQKDIHLGSEASEQTLESLRARGALATFAVIHLATHGKIDDLSPMNSRLLLSQDKLPDPTAAGPADGPAFDGILSAGEVMSTWKLKAELVTLSACRSGLGRQGGGEGFIGFAQAFFLAGSRSLLVSLWEVDDRATSLLMTRFYQNWLGKRPGLSRPLSKAEGLREAKAWLRGLTGAEVERELDRISRGELRSRPGRPAAGRPFEHPHDWAGFILMGDPT